MNPALTIARKEFSLSLRATGTYVVFAIFLVAAGAYFALTALKVGLADLRATFNWMHLLFLIYVPAITMGSIARERSGGTLELISTLPLKLRHIVWGKFLAAWLLLATVLAFTLVLVVLLAVFGIGADFGALALGYLGLLCAGGAFIAIGLFASSLSSNQVLVFLTALAVSGVFFLLGRLGGLISVPLFNAISWLGFDYHLENFLKGVLDSRDLLYFGVVAYIFTLLAELRLQSQNLMQER